MLNSCLKYSAYGLLIFLIGTSDLLAKIDEKNNIKKKSSLNDKWLAIDKLQHFSYSLFLSLGAQYILVSKLDIQERKALPLSSLFSFSAGALKEINDKKGGSYFSAKDMVANGIGILFAGIIINFEPN